MLTAAIGVMDEATSLSEYGGRTRARTWDPLIKSQLLYRLSYASIRPVAAWRPTGRERANSRGVGGWQPVFCTQSKRQSNLGRLARAMPITTPIRIITVIIALPPQLISGNGMPTTGARPITIIMLMAR
jgi:hypothetical protein